MTSGWSIMLPSGWWHVALNDRRHHSVQALLNRLFANLPRDRVGPWRRELGEYLDAQVDAAVAQGATDLYLLSDHRYGLPVAASCLATVLPTAPPPGTPAQVLAVTFAHGDGEPGVVEVDGRLCARVRRQVPGAGTLPAVDADDPKHPGRTWTRSRGDAVHQARGVCAVPVGGPDAPAVVQHPRRAAGRAHGDTLRGDGRVAALDPGDAMTSVNVTYNGLWVEADLDADPLSWAQVTVAQRWAEEDLPPDPELAGLIAENMADVIEVALGQDHPPFMLFLLYPMVNAPYLAAVAVRTEAAQEQDVTLDQLADDIRLPEQMLDKPAEAGIVATPAGPALRLVQRYLAPIEPGIEQVQEAIAYAWIINDGEGPHVVTVSTSFTDLVDAGEWRPAIDALAQSLEVLP
jgi:hypothetical protein